MKKKLLVFFAAILLLAVAAVLSFPYWIVLVPLPQLDIDLGKYLPETAVDEIGSRSLKMKFSLERRDYSSFSLKGEGALLEWPVELNARIHYSWTGLSVDSTANISLPSLDARVEARLAASARDGWTLEATIPESGFGSSDHVLERLAYAFLPQTATDLVFSGKLSLSAEASAKKHGEVHWGAKGRLEDFSFSYLDDGTPMSVEGLRTPFGASGIGAHVDISPMFVRADSLTAGSFSPANLFASVRATETAYLVTEAGCDMLGGKAKIYSTFLLPEKLDAGLTLFLDNIDAGEALSRMACFDGDAYGRLFGKLPIRLKGGKEIMLGDGFLYSVPGTTGHLSMRNSSQLVANLEMGGLSREECSNIERALRNLDYTALTLELQKEDGESHVLKFMVEGTAEEAGITVPVSIEAAFHGEIVQLINLGMRAASRKDTAK